MICPRLGEIKYIASCKILAVNNNPVESFPSNENIQLEEYICGQGTQALLIQLYCSMSISLTVANFFKSILLLKNWRGGGELLLKNVQ